MPGNRPATDAKVACATWMSFYLNLRVIAVSIFANYQPLTLLTASLPRAAAPLTWSGTETTAPQRAARLRAPFTTIAHHWRWMEPARPRRASDVERNRLARAAPRSDALRRLAPAPREGRATP